MEREAWRGRRRGILGQVKVSVDNLDSNLSWTTTLGIKCNHLSFWKVTLRAKKQRSLSSGFSVFAHTIHIIQAALMCMQRPHPIEHRVPGGLIH